MKCLISHATVVAITVFISPMGSAEFRMTMEQAVTLAQQGDPWFEGNQYRQRAMEARSIAAGQLPDPVLSLGLANLPVDDFDFGREPMSQLKVGVSQMFPRGDTRELTRRQLQEQSYAHPLQRQERFASVRVVVSQLWLEAYRHQQALQLIEDDYALFEHLVDVAESNYTSVVGKTRQQDLVRAQLELTRLEDRLTVLEQRRSMSLAKLYEWLPASSPRTNALDRTMPDLIPGKVSELQLDTERMTAFLLAHPKVKVLDQQIIASGTGVEIARQKYKPQWGVNASYGYRDDDPLGVDRDDFFSLGVSFDVPLFTANRQDQELKAARAMEESVKTEKALLLRAMRANFESAVVHLQQLDARKTLYEQRLLREIHAQAEASLTAYTNDTGDFSEVVRARIAELNANIDFLNINVDRLKTIAELNYFLSPISADNFPGVPHE